MHSVTLFLWGIALKAILLNSDLSFLHFPVKCWRIILVQLEKKKLENLVIPQVNIFL